MAEIDDRYGNIRQNLIDAGCDSKTTGSCIARFDEGNMAKMLPTLAKHRQALLNELHKEQKRIECLDYLVYTIQRDGKQQYDTLNAAFVSFNACPRYPIVRSRYFIG